MQRLAVLASGRGSNLAAIADACVRGDIPAELAVVICNVEDAGALGEAKQRGIAAHCVPHSAYADREAFDRALLEVLADNGVNFVALAGFMRILTESFIRQYYGSLLNIHPSVLPKYPGLNTHQRALDSGDHETGATVHFVIPELDAGPAVLHGRVVIRDDDDALRLAARVQQLEHRIFPQALAWCLDGTVTLRDGAAWKNGEPLGEGGIDVTDMDRGAAP